MANRVLVTDAVDPVCIEMLEAEGFVADVQVKRSNDELKKLAADADGWIIRSGTRITSDLIEAAPRLKVIGRAGVGVDNIDLEAATRRGVLVINAPDGNTISTAEHTCAMLLSLARLIPQANASLTDGKWDRKSFTGSEVYEKVLGIVGLGKIGRAVAERMKSFGMQLIGYDPVLSREVAERIGVELVSLDELFAKSDFITFHTPLNDSTRGMLNSRTLTLCKQGVRIINCARGGIVDEADLLDALESGKVGGAALDVYSTEPPPPALEKLIRHPNVISTPHIAASTEEAQEKVARQVTEQVILALKGEPVTTPVNGGAIRVASKREVQPYLKLADKLGQIAAQLCEGRLRSMSVRCSGEIPRRYAEVLTVSAVKGLLGIWINEPVNLINAPILAEEIGLQIEESRDTAKTNYSNLIEVGVETENGSHVVAGTIFNDSDPRIVRINDYSVEVRPEGHLLLYKNVDMPGMLASVGTVLADARINIGALALGRAEKGAMALTVISVDEYIPEPVLERIGAIQGVENVRTVNL